MRVHLFLHCNFTYIKHLADIAVLGGSFGELNSAAAGRVIGDEPEGNEAFVVVAFVIVLLCSTSSGDQFGGSLAVDQWFLGGD